MKDLSKYRWDRALRLRKWHEEEGGGKGQAEFGEQQVTPLLEHKIEVGQ